VLLVGAIVCFVGAGLAFVLVRRRDFVPFRPAVEAPAAEQPA